MKEEFPIIYLARHGETAWSITGQSPFRNKRPRYESAGQQSERIELAITPMRSAEGFVFKSKTVAGKL